MAYTVQKHRHADGAEQNVVITIFRSDRTPGFHAPAKHRTEKIRQRRQQQQQWGLVEWDGVSGSVKWGSGTDGPSEQHGRKHVHPIGFARRGLQLAGEMLRHA